MAQQSLFDSLVRDLENGEGVLTVPLHRVRDACGVKRLRQYTAQQVSDRLRANGIGHLPMEIPLDQMASVRLYLSDTAIGRFIDAAMKPGAANDRKLRELAEEGAADTLQKIKDLLEVA